jgi:hypothetical protein
MSKGRNAAGIGSVRFVEMCGTAVEDCGESPLKSWRFVEVLWRNVEGCGAGLIDGW